jgi:hypothetical protein
MILLVSIIYRPAAGWEEKCPNNDKSSGERWKLLT